MARNPATTTSSSDASREMEGVEIARKQAENEMLASAAAKKSILADIEILEKQVESLDHSKKIIGDEIEKKKVEKAKAEEDFWSFFTKMSAEKDRVEGEITIESKKFLDLQDKVKTLEIEIKGLLNKKTVHENSIHILEISIDDLLSKNSDLEKKILKLEADIKNLDKVKESKEAEIRILDKAIIDRQNEVKALELKKGELSSLGKDIAVKQDEKRVVEDQIRDLNKDVSVKKDELEKVTSETAEKRSVLAKAEQHLSQRLDYAHKFIEKAKVDGLLRKDFEI